MTKLLSLLKRARRIIRLQWAEIVEEVFQEPKIKVL
jgi:hypothetical protein